MLETDVAGRHLTENSQVTRGRDQIHHVTVERQLLQSACSSAGDHDVEKTALAGSRTPLCSRR